MPTDDAVLTCRGLCIGYRGAPLLPPIDLVLRPGELWAVIGRNGSGKTTWIRTVLGLLPPLAGSALPRAGLRRSYLPQRQTFEELYPLLARDVVAMGLDRGSAVFRPRPRDAAQRVASALSLFGANDLSSRPFRQLSEGQKQRVLFARIAAAEPELAVLDEPTSAMDLVAERESYELLRNLQRKNGMTLVVVSHFLGVAREFADRVLLLDRDAQTVALGTPADVLEHDSFRTPFGHARGLP